VNRDVTDALSNDLYVSDDGIKATTNWSQAGDWLTRFVHVMTTGANLDDVLNRGREIGRNVILSGYVNDTSASTPLKLSMDQ
jgi:hypothetical protein